MEIRKTVNYSEDNLKELIEELWPGPFKFEKAEQVSTWLKTAQDLNIAMQYKKQWEEREKRLKDELIVLSNHEAAYEGNFKFDKIERKGNVEYDKIPELKSVNLDAYRKPSVFSWRLTQASAAIIDEINNL